MNLFLIITSLLISWVIGSILVGASIRCYAQRKYDACGIGIMLSVIVVAIVFRLIMSI